MGEGSCLAGEVDCYNVAPVRLEDFALVSQKTFLCTASHDYRLDEFPLTGGPITLGKQSWVAAEAFVAPGVNIGDRAVVLARSVVVHSVPRSEVFGGNPARRVALRDTHNYDFD